VCQQSRRAFLQLAASAFSVRQPASLIGPPPLDGELISGSAATRAAADDWGHHVHRTPRAVLRAASTDDISRIVRYANQNRLKIAMRGQGHSVYGQAQVEGGIVIDSTRLNAVTWHGSDGLDVQAGALWGAVATASLERRLVPPVVPDALMLSAGGTLSVGGTGDTSCSSGAQVDHVFELDVVTGGGDAVTCSASQNAELFHMVRAGLGQCGIIVRARLRLVPAATYLMVRTVTYDDVVSLLSDQAALAKAGPPSVLSGEITKNELGRWRYALIGGITSERPDKEPSHPPWMTGLKHTGSGRPAIWSFWDYLNRRTDSIAATKARGTPNPSLAVVLPESSVRPFLEAVLSDEKLAAGIWRVEVLPMLVERFTAPLHVLPEAPVAFTVRLQRRASAENAPDHQAMLSANRALATRCMDSGGKVYPPFAPPLSRDDWQRHYGNRTWARLAAARREFDPNGILTPGAGVFG
jgi:FAD/FMN-containing dehydrogenase